MSPKNSLLTIGLTALGLLGHSATRAEGPAEPPAPTGLAPAPASSVTHSVLLKTNGDLLTGPIREDAGRYVVQMSGGPIPVPKSKVEKTFGSIAEVYRYKRAQVPEADPDEHFKLARWCLSQNMPAEATVELRTVVSLSPKAVDAKAMLAKLEASAERAAKPRLDPALIQTGGDEATMAAPKANDPRPAEIDASAIRRAQRDLGVSGLPVIFDLPPALAVKRAEQFARDVHPLLQAACVRCHNEQHTGSFQLVEVKSRRGPSGDALRANLDATLRLVDPENPARSELLSSALVPHGNRPNPRPIFGSNDRRYQIIAAWVNSLRAPRPSASEGVTPTRFVPKDTATLVNDGFAVERAPGQGALPGVATTPLLNQAPAPRIDRKELPPMRAVPGQGMVAERQPPDAGEFPAPYLLGGPKPALTTGPAPLPPTTAPAVPAMSPAPVDSLPPLPGSPVPASTTQPPASAPVPASAAKPKTPLKLDVDLLQRAILNRNNGR